MTPSMELAKQLTLAKRATFWWVPMSEFVNMASGMEMSLFANVSVSINIYKQVALAWYNISLLAIYFSLSIQQVCSAKF